MKTPKVALPFKWPFPPPTRPAAPAPVKARRRLPLPGDASRKSMVADVVMVIFWGASIPGLMWLGAVGGF